MRQMTAWCAAAALLSALLCAPLFHVHAADHRDADAVVHAHFAELQRSPHGAKAEFEPDHASEQGRSIDVLTVDTPQAVTLALVSWKEPLPERLLPFQFVAASFETPQAHGPPDTGPSVPRSPPLL